MAEVDDLVDARFLGDVEPPTVTPVAGATYQRLLDEPAYRVVERGFVIPAHRAWAEAKLEQGRPAPFYVMTDGGQLGWVPWPGSKVVWPQDVAWEMDLFNRKFDDRDLRPSEKK